MVNLMSTCSNPHLDVFPMAKYNFNHTICALWFMVLKSKVIVMQLWKKIQEKIQAGIIC